MLKKLIRPFTSLRQYILSVLLLCVFILALLGPSNFNDLGDFLVGLVWTLIIFLTQWFGNTYIGVKLDEKFPILEYPLKRAIYGLVGLIVYSVFAYIIVQVIMYTILFGGIPSNIYAWIISLIKVVVPISALIAFIFTSIGFFGSWKKAELNAQKMETEMLRYKYESLQNQINPHFLFNSFNVLSDLVIEDPKMAVKFIQKLSVLYRYVLESKEKELVPLAEEVDFIRSYIFLLKTRFENKLQIELNLQDIDNQLIVPMGLQLLIENAVKHNMATSHKILKVVVEKEGDRIVVKNNLQLKSSLETSTKKGLENLRQQYRFFTDKEVIVEHTETEFIVKIPLLNK